MAARLGRAVHPCRCLGPCGEPKRGHLASLEHHRRCTTAATPERCAHGCASARGWSGGGGRLALLWSSSYRFYPHAFRRYPPPKFFVASLGLRARRRASQRDRAPWPSCWGPRLF
eukprot:scaffold25055_cov68-Phaeocystis_antarctica.AAC.1